jgi:hypothetical protein
MACQAASATASPREVLKAGPLCLQRTLDPKKISAMALNSTRPKRGTSLILYRGAVVMPRCSSKARSLPVRIGDSALKDSTSSASRYIFSSSVSLGGGCSLWSCLLCHGPPVVATPQPASPKPLGSQEPLALSRKVPLLVMPPMVCRAGTLEATAHSEVPADRWVDGRALACGAAGMSHLSFRREEYETIKFYKTKD